MKHFTAILCLLFIASTSFAGQAGDEYDEQMMLECINDKVPVDGASTTVRLNKSAKKDLYEISVLKRGVHLKNGLYEKRSTFTDLQCQFQDAKSQTELGDVVCSKDESWGDNVKTTFSLQGQTLALRTSGMHDDTVHVLMRDSLCELAIQNLRSIGSATKY